jgi:hypothetical protein
MIPPEMLPTRVGNGYETEDWNPQDMGSLFDGYAAPRSRPSWTSPVRPRSPAPNFFCEDYRVQNVQAVQKVQTVFAAGRIGHTDRVDAE